MRGYLLAFSSAALGVTAHLLADGALPDLALTLLLTVLIGWTSTSLAGRTRGVPGILALLAAGQLLLHLVLTELAAHGHDGQPGAPSDRAMLLAHIGATLVTALLLAHTESMLLAVAATVLLTLPLVWRPVAVPGGPVRPVSPARGPGPVDVQLRRICGRRGPPAHS